MASAPLLVQQQGLEASHPLPPGGCGGEVESSELGIWGEFRVIDGFCCLMMGLMMLTWLLFEKGSAHVHFFLKTATYVLVDHGWSSSLESIDHSYSQTNRITINKPINPYAAWCKLVFPPRLKSYQATFRAANNQPGSLTRNGRLIHNRSPWVALEMMVLTYGSWVPPFLASFRIFRTPGCCPHVDTKPCSNRTNQRKTLISSTKGIYHQQATRGFSAFNHCYSPIFSIDGTGYPCFYWLIVPSMVD